MSDKSIEEAAKETVREWLASRDGIDMSAPGEPFEDCPDLRKRIAATISSEVDAAVKAEREMVDTVVVTALGPFARARVMHALKRERK